MDPKNPPSPYSHLGLCTIPCLGRVFTHYRLNINREVNLASGVRAGYQAQYERFKEEVVSNSRLSPCEKLEEFRILAIALAEAANGYWRKECWRSWSCVPTYQSKIDEIKKELAPIEMTLMRECAISGIVWSTESVAKQRLGQSIPVVNSIERRLNWEEMRYQQSVSRQFSCALSRC